MASDASQRNSAFGDTSPNSLLFNQLASAWEESTLAPPCPLKQAQDSELMRSLDLDGFVITDVGETGVICRGESVRIALDVSRQTRTGQLHIPD